MLTIQERNHAKRKEIMLFKFFVGQTLFWLLLGKTLRIGSMLEFVRLVTEVPRSERKVETRTTYFTFIVGIMAGFDGVSGMVEVYQFRPHMAVSCYSWYTGICVGLYLAAAIAGVVGRAVTERRMPWKTCARVCCGSAAYLGITAVVYDWFRRQIRTPQEPIVYNTISGTITSTARDLRDPGTWAGMAVLVGIVFGLAWLCGIFQKRE